MPLTFKKERETKNTVRFAEVPQNGKDTAMDTAYIKKAFLDAEGLSGEDEIELEIRKKA